MTSHQPENTKTDIIITPKKHLAATESTTFQISESNYSAKKKIHTQQNAQITNHNSPIIQRTQIRNFAKFYTPEKTNSALSKFDYNNTQPSKKQSRHQTTQLTCNCRKSGCLKFYCVCFSEGQMCNKNCRCDDCLNKIDNMKRAQAINDIIVKDQHAFYKRSNPVELSHPLVIGCNCRKSKCKKNYCECFRRGNQCGSNCHCSQCTNMNESKSNFQNSALSEEEIFRRTYQVLKKKLKVQQK